MVWGGFYLKSNPPQVNLYLTLKDSGVGNTCDKLWKNTLEFDLKKISEISKGSIINLFDSIITNSPRYKLVYLGKEGSNNTDVCPEDFYFFYKNIKVYSSCSTLGAKTKESITFPVGKSSLIG